MRICKQKKKIFRVASKQKDGNWIYLDVKNTNESTTSDLLKHDTIIEAEFNHQTKDKERNAMTKMRRKQEEREHVNKIASLVALEQRELKIKLAFKKFVKKSQHEQTFDHFKDELMTII